MPRSVVLLSLLVCCPLLSQNAAPPEQSRAPNPPVRSLSAAPMKPPAKSSTKDPDTPVGHWIAHHPSREALSLWWNFRADGTVTATAGGMVNSTYTLKGTTLTVAPSSTGEPPSVFDIHLSGDRLLLVKHAERSPAMEFARIGSDTGGTKSAAPNAPGSAEPAIAGSWRLVHASDAIDPEAGAIRTMKMIVVYGTDGSYHARMPMKNFDGRWDASAHTYQLKGHPALHFERLGNDLKISIPPDGKETHVYFNDLTMDFDPTP